MNVKEFYENIGGSYSDATNRLMNDSLILKFVLKYQSHDYVNDIKEAIMLNDFDKIFFAAHTLKGVALNLAFIRLGNAASDLTEYLRGENKNVATLSQINELFNKIKQENDIVVSNILKLGE